MKHASSIRNSRLWKDGDVASRCSSQSPNPKAWTFCMWKRCTTVRPEMWRRRANHPLLVPEDRSVTQNIFHLGAFATSVSTSVCRVGPHKTSFLQMTFLRFVCSYCRYLSACRREASVDVLVMDTLRSTDVEGCAVTPCFSLLLCYIYQFVEWTLLILHNSSIRNVSTAVNTRLPILVASYESVDWMIGSSVRRCWLVIITRNFPIFQDEIFGIIYLYKCSRK
jgi:hypothetical protein